MPTLLDLPAGLYRGRVEGAESGRCEARFDVRWVPGGCVAVDYEAVGAEGVQHIEHTVVAPGALYVAHSEGSGVRVFTETEPGVYDASPGGPFDLRLVVGWDGEQLTWAWHWAPAGEAVREQSRAVARLAEQMANARKDKAVITRANDSFWDRLARQTRANGYDWQVASEPSGNSGLRLSATLIIGRECWFAARFLLNAGLSSELNLRGSGELVTASLDHARTVCANLSDHYGGELRCELLSSGKTLRIFDRRDADRDDREAWDGLIDWLLDSQVRLRQAVELVGGAAAILGIS